MDNDIILKLENVKKYFYPHTSIVESLLKKSKEIKINWISPLLKASIFDEFVSSSNELETKI